ncbi:MAG: nucleotidyl transferase AbiEii/AbiGii toxin family protein [Gammaproteobacteria bacterium]|nr:nucleotidyl transferase AbiEii/AbiGii toxin family protein [Gammaproteobacteria bacterium]
MYSKEYEKQVRLLLQCLPLLEEVNRFALKGGTAINFFLKNMPRLSVDIDLTYMPIEPREETFANMQSDLKMLGNLIEKVVPNSRVSMQIAQNTGHVVRLLVYADGTQIKVEPSFVVRGTLYQPEYLNLCKRAEDEFEMSIKNVKTLSSSEIYAGKICAALNRQHPRDLFDIHVLLSEQGITDKIRQAFVVYLAGDARPLHEMLNPSLLDIETIYQRQFHRMTMEAITLDELLMARENLIQKISEDLTLNERKFLLSIKLGAPQWDLLPFKNLEQLPSLQWKLINIRKMNKIKHQKMVGKLKDVLEL